VVTVTKLGGDCDWTEWWLWLNSVVTVTKTSGDWLNRVVTIIKPGGDCD
jgi:hypothetical protein